MKYSVGLCRESDTAPYEFYIQGSDDFSLIFDADKEGLTQALTFAMNNCNQDRFIVDVVRTWFDGVVRNA